MNFFLLVFAIDFRLSELIRSISPTNHTIIIIISYLHENTQSWLVPSEIFTCEKQTFY